MQLLPNLSALRTICQAYGRCNLVYIPNSTWYYSHSQKSNYLRKHTNWKIMCQTYQPYVWPGGCLTVVGVAGWMRPCCGGGRVDVPVTNPHGHTHNNSGDQNVYTVFNVNFVEWIWFMILLNYHHWLECPSFYHVTIWRQRFTHCHYLPTFWLLPSPTATNHTSWDGPN